MLTIEYKLKLSDLTHAERHWRQSRFARKNIIVGTLFLLFGLYCISVGYLVSGGLVILIGTAEILNLLPSSILAPLIEWKRNPKFREKVRLTLSSDELHFTTPTIDSTVKWDFYRECVETKEMFILMYGKSMYTIVPKRACVDSQQIQELADLVETRLKRAK